MDMKNYTKLVTLLFFSCSFLSSVGASSLLASSIEARGGYLSFHAPPKLRFHEVPTTADRSNLLRLGSPATEAIEIVLVEDNASSEVSEFPLTSYDGEDLTDSFNETPDTLDTLPPADPFVDYSMEPSGIDSTDQLIQIFESMENSGRPASQTSVNFIPPYTLDSGNFQIESRSSYTRRVRP